MLVQIPSILAPSWEVPIDALYSVDEAARLEGLSAFTSISAMPVGAETEDDMVTCPFEPVLIFTPFPATR